MMNGNICRITGHVLLTCLLCLFSASCSSTSISHLLRAEELRSAEKYQEAIAEYQTYIDLRLKQKTVSDDYSPYFYYLLIGEAYLKLNQPDQARDAFLKAQEHGTSPALVADKFRLLAGWYEERKRYDEAIAVLHEFRRLDPLMFDSDLDRNHKEQISAEDRNNNSSEDNDSAPRTGSPATN